MRIEFLGHACFRIRLSSGRVLLIDPYEIGGLSGRLRYRAVDTAASVVLLSHDHRDHCDLSWVGGQPVVVREEWRDHEIEVHTAVVAHDEFGGKLRGGRSNLLLIRAEGLHLVHCGDLGERLLPEQMDTFGPVDVLMVPVGGYYTLGPQGAAELTRQVAPRYALPCHYRTPACDLDNLLPLERFTRRFHSSRWPGVVVQADFLDPAEISPHRPTVVALRPLGLDSQ